MGFCSKAQVLKDVKNKQTSTTMGFKPSTPAHPQCICGLTVDKLGTQYRWTPRVPRVRKRALMASSTFSISLATFSSPAALFSNTKTSIACLKPHERALASSLLATRTSIYYKTSRARPMSLRNGSRGVTCSASSSALPSALLFDCDGVLVDTEKDGHRVSFNDTFTEVCMFSCFFLSLCFMSLV